MYQFMRIVLYMGCGIKIQYSSGSYGCTFCWYTISLMWLHR